MSNKHSVGDQPAFPDSNLTTEPGMSYRLWLIGQIAKGTMANPNSWDTAPENITRITFDQVDAILALLDKERGER